MDVRGKRDASVLLAFLTRRLLGQPEFSEPKPGSGLVDAPVLSTFTWDSGVR